MDNRTQERPLVGGGKRETEQKALAYVPALDAESPTPGNLKKGDVALTGSSCSQCLGGKYLTFNGEVHRKRKELPLYLGNSLQVGLEGYSISRGGPTT